MSGYSHREKMHIAQNHLLPRQLDKNGICPDHLIVNPDAILHMSRFFLRYSITDFNTYKQVHRQIEIFKFFCQKLILEPICKKNFTLVESYTMEAGVRQLERQLGAVCRHGALKLAEVAKCQRI